MKASLELAAAFNTGTSMRWVVSYLCCLIPLFRNSNESVYIIWYLKFFVVRAKNQALFRSLIRTVQKEVIFVGHVRGGSSV